MSDRGVLAPALCTRRRFPLGAAGGLAGAAAWLQGWPHLMAAPAPKDAPSGQMTWAVHVTIAPTWFDPAETSGVITPYMFLYAIHDALIKPMPDNPMAPSLATAWTESADGLTYDFELREGVKFHNGDPFTAEDVQFSFERYKGAAFGNAATRIETFMYSKGAQSFLNDPEIDAWYAQQATERDRQKRQAILHRIRQKVYDEAYFGPFWELGSCAPQARARPSPHDKGSLASATA